MPSPKTSARAKKSTEVLRIHPRGDLVASTVEAERESMLAALETAEKEVVLDLSGTKQIDSLGITLILGLYKSCQKAGIAFCIEAVNPDLMRVFKLFSMPKLFSIAEARP